MVNNKMMKMILALVCAVCFIGAIGFTRSALAREGALAVAAAFWLLGVEIKRSGRYQSDLPQVFVLLLLGGGLWLIGDVPSVDVVFNSGSAKLAILGLLAKSIGLVAIPTCFCFYMVSPSRPLKAAKRTISVVRPAVSNDRSNYQIAV